MENKKSKIEKWFSNGRKNNIQKHMPGTQKVSEELGKAKSIEMAVANFETLDKTWGDQYPIIIRSWRNNWNELTTYFQFPSEIRRLIYSTNTVEDYNCQLRKVVKTKGGFPNPESVRKILYLATMDIVAKWNAPFFGWKKILNQLSIYFDREIE